MIDWLKPIRGRSEEITFGAVSISEQKVGARLQLCIRLSNEAVSKFRFVAGDRVFVGLDSVTKEVILKRTNEKKGTYCVSSNGKHSRMLSIKASVSLPKKSTIRFSEENVKVDGQLIQICVPGLFK